MQLFSAFSPRRVHTLIGHMGEISNVQFNWDCSLIISGSMDKTCKVSYYQPDIFKACFFLFFFPVCSLSSQGEISFVACRNRSIRIVIHLHFKLLARDWYLKSDGPQIGSTLFYAFPLSHQPIWSPWFQGEKLNSNSLIMPRWVILTS